MESLNEPLSLGQRLVTAARIAAAEHVRQELEAASRQATQSAPRPVQVIDQAQGLREMAGVRARAAQHVFPEPAQIGPVKVTTRRRAA